jgi:hypothetical protein
LGDGCGVAGEGVFSSSAALSRFRCASLKHALSVASSIESAGKGDDGSVLSCPPADPEGEGGSGILAANSSDMFDKEASLAMCSFSSLGG